MGELRKAFNFEDGELLLIDKPLEWTSFDVVNHLRVAIKRNIGIAKLKVGHAGTLDPLATGLLLLCTGKMTKKIQFLQDKDKVYAGTMKLGFTTPSYDMETEADAVFSTENISIQMLEEARHQFLGDIEQLPPVYSAVKIDGKRAFNYARKQQEVQLIPRKVHIASFEIDPASFPDIHFKVSCSKGTYIRSLVHDFGKALGIGATLTALRRTQIGEFKVDDAWKLEDLKLAIIDLAATKQKT
jgi:tRNA pseudouridine55 synthase